MLPRIVILLTLPYPIKIILYYTPAITIINLLRINSCFIFSNSTLYLAKKKNLGRRYS